ncbi:MAG: four helix bundle protein, partial [Muribaculaceae bacterium]|nr:four helix bundle protein [Muribaculaceae bacterium]
MDNDNQVGTLSKNFARRCVYLYRLLCEQRKEYILSKQLLRSGTSIGANISESEYAQSKADFISKLSIALKEAAETKYWIELLYDCNYLDEVECESILNDCLSLIKLLT